MKLQKLNKQKKRQKLFHTDKKAGLSDYWCAVT